MLNFSSKRSYVFLIELLNPSRTRAVSKYEVPTLFCPKKSFAKWNSQDSPKKLDIQVVPPCQCSPWNTPTISVSSLTEELQQLEISGISSGQGPVRGKRLGYSKPMPPYNFRISRWRSCGEAAALLPVFFWKPKCWRRNFLCQTNVEVSRMSVEREKIKQWRSSDGDFFLHCHARYSDSFYEHRF